MRKRFTWTPILLLYLTKFIDHFKRDMIFFTVPVLKYFNYYQLQKPNHFKQKNQKLLL